jgi:hypothetical protein
MVASLTLDAGTRLGKIKEDKTDSPLPGGSWYLADAVGDGLGFDFPAGILAGYHSLTADLLLDGGYLAVFNLVLQEGASGPTFVMSFGLLNQVSARMRVPLEAVNQNRWRYPREGAWLKPLCSGDRVDLTKVDRVRLVINRKGPDPVRFCMTPLSATVEAPPLLANLILPEGPLIDAMGQSTLHTWPGKSRSPASVSARLQAQCEAAPEQVLPEAISRWGGWKERQVEATGFFRTHHDGDRWWLVDPEGYLFWSSGMDCVRFGIESAYEGLEDALTWLPEDDSAYASAFTHGERMAFDYLKANFIRAFGADTAYARWAEIALGYLRRFGFNTVANWSDWDIARGDVPYVRAMHGRELPSIPSIYRDFPDVFHPDFEAAAATFAEQLRETADDPALIGYFLMNEPNWGFAQETPAAGMLQNTPSCHTRGSLADFLKARYGAEATFREAWGAHATYEGVTRGEWMLPLTAKAEVDLADFSEVMVSHYFGTLSDACRMVDPRHLNLGIRYYTIPPAWVVEGMRTFDVFSMNCYKSRILAEEMAKVNEMLDMPIMIGEWHFGALDVGLPASGIGRVADQEARGQAFRVYVEDAAVKPWCVGVHYFTLYDQSALGRFDGENYNIGFLDVCHRPYAALADAARETHERLYEVASRVCKPFEEAPIYLPMLFL